MTADSLDEWGLPTWPAAERNKQPILEALTPLLPAVAGTLLEVASGTGQHAAHFARCWPSWRIQPSDCDPEHLETLTRRAQLEELSNLLPPVALDVLAAPNAALRPDVIYCANMLHIAPRAASDGLFRVAGTLLRHGAALVTYGPYQFGGVFTAESNQRFDESLRARNSDWGVRDVDELSHTAGAAGFHLEQTLQLPANNFILLWRKVPGLSR